NGQVVDKMNLAVEMLVDRSFEDSWGAEVELTYTRMRYELEISRRQDEQGLEGLHILHESLKAIPRSSDIWCKRHGISAQNNWLPKAAGDGASFIATEQDLIVLYKEVSGSVRRGFARRTERTLLSRVMDEISYPHAWAAREEIRSWK